jgi:hypothetical protein
MRSSHLNRLNKLMPFEEWEKLFDTTPHDSYHNSQMRTRKCPICNSDTWHESYDQDHFGCVEHWDNCKGCGFYEGWAYGRWECGFIVNKFHRSSHVEDYEEIPHVIAFYKKRYKRQQKLMWKKKKSQRKKRK